tara:strand:- start:90 stop:944 length:855 start_codon:yes stop_codon:yes gene_type:complete
MGGLYDILEAQRLQGPKFTYEGLYQDPMSKLATANPLKAMFNPNFEYMSPSAIEKRAKAGGTNLQGYVPIDYDRAIDFKRLFEDRPLKPTDGVKRFENFDPRVGTITPFQPYENPTYQMKQQLGMVPTGIMTQAPTSLGFDTSFGVANEEDVEQEFLPDQKSGIAKLFDFLSNFIPGISLLRRLSDNSGIKSLNKRIQESDFGRSKNLMDFLDMKKFGGYEGREKARAATMAQARGIQKKIDRGEFGTASAQDKARGQISSRKTSAPKRSFSSDYSAAQRARKF